MPIPDNIIFSPHLTEDRAIRFSEIRQLSDSDLKLRYLKKRLDEFLLKQVNPLGEKMVYSPFPLAILTCIAVETLGRILEPVAKLEEKYKKEQISKLVSVKVYGLLDKKLTRPLTLEAKDAMKKHWGKHEIKTYAELFHSYLRTSFIHGYKAKNVFLTEETISWVFENGSLYVNPYWFWKAFREIFESSFEEILNAKEKNNPVRKNAIEYFERLINE